MTIIRVNYSGSSIVTGTLLATFAFANLAFMNVLAKKASHSTPVPVIIFFQNLFCLLAIMPFIWFQGWGKLKTTRFGTHFIRAAAGTGSLMGLFLALKLMPLTNAVLITYSAPIWIPLIARVIHGSKTQGMVWIAVVIGFIGIVLVLRPTTIKITWGAPLALGAAILLALALVSIRWLNKTEPNLRILFYFFLISSLINLPFSLLNWQTPNPSTWIYLLGVGACLLSSQVFLIIAYKYASAVTLAPIVYTVILFTVIINWIGWNQIPSTIEVLGMTLIVLGGLIAMKCGRHKKNEKIE